MTLNEPRDSFPSDAELASFLEGSTREMQQENEDPEKAQALHNQRLEDEANVIIVEVLERKGYTPSTDNVMAFKEQHLLKEASQILQIYQGYLETPLTIAQGDFFNRAKKRLFAVGAITHGLPTDTPIFTILEEVLPGEKVDFDDENMIEFSLEAMEILANTRVREQRWFEFHNGLRGLIESFGGSADEDFGQSISQGLINFTDDIIALLNRKTITSRERTQLLDYLAKSSSFGDELAQSIITYTKEHKHLLE